MEKVLRLKTYVDGGINDTPFPNSEGQIEIGQFRYDAKRMGGAPTITASVNYPSCLDDEWTDNVYAEFNGEKYYLKQTPTSSYNNESTMYKHDLELISERSILDNVYFFDTVVGEPEGDDKPVSNSTKVVFFGGIREFAARLNSSLQYSHLDYDVVVDDDDNITKEEKLMSFEDQFFSNVLQEIYNTYEVPYYFEGKTIHIGWAKNDVDVPTFAYGVDDALLSISKNNANYKIVNRATGTGSSDNIPFYYPNNSPKGNIGVESELDVRIVNAPLFANEIDINGEIVYQEKAAEISKVLDDVGNIAVLGKPSIWAKFTYKGFSTRYKIYIDTIENSKVQLYLNPLLSFTRYQTSDDKQGQQASGTTTIRLFVDDRQVGKSEVSALGEYFEFDLEEGSHVVEANISFAPEYNSSTNVFEGNVGLEWGIDTNAGWRYNRKEVTLKDIGLSLPSGVTPTTGDTIKQILIEYINTSQNLLPSKYRETKGAERFYNATNDTYEGVTFNNPFVAGKPKEHIFKVEDIKPSIEGMEVNRQRIDMFEAFAYDEDDNDETYEEEDGNIYFKHPYFFAKLKPLGFNLFDHAIEQQPMTISFTSGACGACNFEIAVDEESQKNTVQVDANGDLIYENGRVLCGVEGSGQGDVQPQPEQQDTTNRSVWIALRKEEDTYGILMPKAPIDGAGGHRPTTDDTFVILGINLPDEYILNAERRLEEEIIKCLQDNNDEKFTFSIGFSRIYFAENEDVLNSLNENSKIQITYDNKTYGLYISSFSYTMSESEALPEIRVELDDTLKVSQNAIQKAISQVKSELGRAINSIDIVNAATPYFISKKADDEARGKINFTKGIKFGEGGKVEVLDNNSAKLTIEYLEVTKKATFTSLEIQEKTHVGGQILVTPASLNCGEVEEFEDFYRCYFQTKGEDGDEIFNQFAVNDQAICQTFNTWGSVYYWRLVVGVGEDYIDLSKTDCDEDSDAPAIGDKIIQLGNREDSARQNAIVIAAYGDGSPYIIQYKGINSYELPSEKIVTKLSSTENIFTGKVHMEMGSEGLSALDEWLEADAAIKRAQGTADEALEKVDAIGESSFEELRGYVDTIAEDLQGQIDGAIDSYFYEYEPSLDNIPAVDWDTAEEKASHLNDTFTNLTDGRSWRWSLSNGVYSWVEITDTATSQALALAGQAQETADGKMTVFINQPKPPYKAGDLWAGGEDMPLRRCIVARESGSYVASDWAIADNAQAYADAIKAEMEQNVANTALELQTSIDKAKEDSKDYTDEANAVINQRISEVEQAKANLEDVYDKATMDGKLSQAEADAISAAKAYANAQNDYLDLTLRAWADGEIDDAEQRAIDEAESKVASAKEEMEKYTDEAIASLEFGGQNLLRNSGFTGDYLSEQLADESVLKAASELYSAPLDHWAATNVVVNDSAESSSGKEVSMANGTLSQKLYYKVVKDESYVISFKAKGTSLKLTVGLFTKNIALSTTWEQYEEVFTTTTEASTFEISNATCSLCEVQLERGTKRTAWSNSPLDNSSERAYYQSMKYLSSAIVDGSTDILGGLVLTNQIKVGNYANQEMIEETGGMNGSYTDAESPFLWGGGTLQEAIATIAKHEVGTATPAGEIPFAVTHGGKVILNDAIVRGKVHIGAGSSGLEDFQEWHGKQSQIDLASSNASSAQSMANEAKNAANDAAAAANSYQYIANALTNGSTTIDNGLILTSLILLGTMSGYNFVNKAGVNGDYSTDNSPAFWAGGTLDQATTTITKYLQDPTFQPTDADLATMAKAVITHGGRAILNDIILRGTVYATGGEFTGTINARGLYIDCNKIIGAPEQGFLPTIPQGDIRMYIDNGEFVVEEIDNNGHMLNEARVGSNRVMVSNKQNYSTTIMAGRIHIANEGGTQTIQ